MQQINWHLGQAVLPEHFTLSQHLSVERNIALCEINSPTDFYGLAELKINEHLFEKNVLRIEALTYITIKSEVIIYRYRSHPNSLELNLNTIDSDLAEIALCVNNRDILKDVADGDTKVQTKLPNVTLAVNLDEVNELSNFRILTLKKLETGKWSLAEFLPPILTTDVFAFNAIMDKLSSLLTTLRAYVSNEKSSNTTISAVKLMLLNNISSDSNTLEYNLLQLKHTKYSPMSIYQNVLKIYIGLLQYHDIADIDRNLIYKHDTPYKSFQALFTEILNMILHTKAVEYKVFNPVENLLSTGTIATEALNRKKHYLVIRKPTEDYGYNLAAIKLTSPSRIEYVNKYAMVGLKLSKVSFNPLPASNIDKNCDIYEIVPSREWDYILSEQIICLLNTKDVSSLKFVYYFI